MEQEFKVCKDCGRRLNVELFLVDYIYKNTGKKVRKPRCKVCNNLYQADWGRRNKDKVKKYNNYETAKKARKRYRDTHKEEQCKYLKEHAEEIREGRRRRQKGEKRRKYDREYKRRKRKENIDFKIYCDIKKRMLDALDSPYTMKGEALKLLGCDIPFLRKYLESKFTEGMTWNNHAINGWHIDHILPVDSFNLKDPQEQKRCFHWSNMQPLWAGDNLKKSNKILLVA
jgi:hypothetical protein